MIDNSKNLQLRFIFRERQKALRNIQTFSGYISHLYSFKSRFKLFAKLPTFTNDWSPSAW